MEELGISGKLNSSFHITVGFVVEVWLDSSGNLQQLVMSCQKVLLADG
jgi:hypothetical protein